MKEAVALILSLNAHSFKVHELFANTIPELSLIKTLIDSYGGHVQIHPEMSRIMEDLNDPNGTREDVNMANNVRDIPSDTIPEDQKSEEPSSSSDDLPQDRNRKYSPNHNFSTRSKS